jgi:hypothetical protein
MLLLLKEFTTFQYSPNFNIKFFYRFRKAYKNVQIGGFTANLRKLRNCEQGLLVVTLTDRYKKDVGATNSNAPIGKSITEPAGSRVTKTFRFM